MGSPKSGVPSPATLGSAEIMSLKQQIEAIKTDPMLKAEQKNAKISDLLAPYPHLRRSKPAAERMMKRPMPHETMMPGIDFTKLHSGRKCFGSTCICKFFSVQKIRFV
jgi:hypothetical protein